MQSTNILSFLQPIGVQDLSLLKNTKKPIVFIISIVIVHAIDRSSYFLATDWCTRCSQVNECTMTTSAVKPGVLISLQDLNPSSPLFKQGSSLRVTGKLQEYSVETAIALIVDGCYKLKIDTQHLRDLSFRVGSIYQFIGEVLIQPDNEAVLQARVGRNVDGIDLNLYYKSLQLLTQFQSEHMIDD